MTILKLPSHEGKIFYINIDHIVCWMEDKDLYPGGSRLIMIQGGPIFTPVKDHQIPDLIWRAEK